MQASFWRADHATLVAALTDPPALVRYQESLAAEHEITAEQGAIDHLRRMHAIAGRALVQGFDQLARQDAPAADRLLTDLIAVATWRGWELPAEPQGEGAFDPGDLPSGLLGTGSDADGAAIWPVDGSTIALVRGRCAVSPPARGDHSRT